MRGLSSFSSWCVNCLSFVALLHDMWDFPEPGIGLAVPPSFAGRFLSTPYHHGSPIMILKCKTLQVRAYHLYVNLPRKCLFSAYQRVFTYRVSYSLLGEDRKKRYSRSDCAKTYGEKLHRIRSRVWCVFRRMGREVILFSERETERECVCVMGRR